MSKRANSKARLHPLDEDQTKLFDTFRSLRACRDGSWSLVLQKRDGTGEPIPVPFHCRSWRHMGECREACGRCDYARIVHAIKSREGWCYLVLTFFREKKTPLHKVFREGMNRWAKLRKRLQHRYPGLEYIQTWEVHKDGYPHVNVLLHHPDLVDRAKSNRRDESSAIGKLAVECGFGKEHYFDAVWYEKGMAAYLRKLSTELTGSGEKSYQIPLNAPPHFRRIRASRGLLPARIRSEEFTGTLVPFSADQLAEFRGEFLEQKTCKRK